MEISRFDISLAADSQRVDLALESVKDESTAERKLAKALIALGWVDELSGTVEMLADELGQLLPRLGSHGR